MSERIVDTSNFDPKYWEEILADEGMPSNLSRIPGKSLESARKTEHDIREGLDNAIVTENIFSSEIPLNKSGLAPCQRAKLEGERSSTAVRSTRFDIQ